VERSVAIATPRVASPMSSAARVVVGVRGETPYDFRLVGAQHSEVVVQVAEHGVVEPDGGVVQLAEATELVLAAR
jgi:hypothetical protein